MLDQLPWPPETNDEQLAALVQHIHDWQITHSSLLKLIWTEQKHTVLAQPIGVSLWPTLFPKASFEQALRLQTDFNELYTAAACDEEWLYQTLKPLMTAGSLTSKLWSIHEKVKEEGYVQQTSLGIFRSDYMLHAVPNPGSRPSLKQVEFNTFSCAGACHSSQISSLHRHLQRIGAYPTSISPPNSTIPNPITLPASDNTSSLASALAKAHRAYGPPKSRSAPQTGILMLVQPCNVNICDERPLEYALWDRGIPTYRATFPDDVTSHTSSTSTRELLYRPPTRTRHHLPPLEISVAYLRAGYDEAEYATDQGVAARYRLERSRAIKCPSLLAHLTTLKKVQQVLARPGVLERFLSAEKAGRVRETFMPMYPLDRSEAGMEGRTLAFDWKMSGSHVLKPSLEGGGHNVYGKEIPEFLEQLPTDMFGAYVLMETIRPPPLRNVLMSPRGVHEGPVISELGVLGLCLWNHQGDNGKQEVNCDLLMNEQAGFTFKTKASEVDEMSVVKGYGCFDSPCLIDDE
ncbi:MAG: hypothetical protein LQ340_000951 [Diploschistes diacapsis]|nr:MAG: hypothetical protein LQ340_000951 [Diploschistes diacapsis]